MVNGVSGQLVVKHVVEAIGPERVQLDMEKLIVKKDMDLEIEKYATLTNAPADTTIEWDEQDCCCKKCFQNSKCRLYDHQ